MISKKLLSGINQQIVNELGAMTGYLTIACYMDSQDLKVLSAHFLKQSDEERDHALKLMGYLLDINAKVEIGAVPKPEGKFSSVKDAVKRALEQEEEVSAQINNLMKIAHDDNDYASISFLKWFVDEQVEEVASMTELLGLVERAGDSQLLLVEDRLMRQGIAAQGKSE